jgi:hypothetical protein
MPAGAAPASLGRQGLAGCEGEFVRGPLGIVPDYRNRAYSSHEILLKFRVPLANVPARLRAFPRGPCAGSACRSWAALRVLAWRLCSRWAGWVTVRGPRWWAAPRNCIFFYSELTNAFLI